MKILRSPKEMQRFALRWRRAGRRVGFVPTMGALHEGHLRLVRQARTECDIVVLSIFVNPTQFAPGEDMARYPRPRARDLALARRAGVDVAFCPTAAGLTPAGGETWVTVPRLSAPLCGLRRPGHFRGVATVVVKLLNLVLPARAYFGRKDYQQWRVIERMVRDLHIPVRIVGVPTVRARDGLALSSRNRYLSQAARRAARGISAALQEGQKLLKSSVSIRPSVLARRVRRALVRTTGVRVEYVKIVDPKTLLPLKTVRRRALLAVAVRLGGARLIDNRIITR